MPEAIRLRRLLKIVLRRLGFRCIEIVPHRDASPTSATKTFLAGDKYRNDHAPIPLSAPRARPSARDTTPTSRGTHPAGTPAAGAGRAFPGVPHAAKGDESPLDRPVSRPGDGKPLSVAPTAGQVHNREGQA